MPKLYEALLRMNYSTAEDHQKRIRAELEKAVVIRADNVAEYFFVHDEKDEWMIDRDFPNLAPPFETFWIEYKSPTKINISGVVKEVDDGLLNITFGFLFVATEPVYGTIPEEARWIVTVVGFVMLENGDVQQNISWTLGVTNLGQVVKLPDGDIAFALTSNKEFTKRVFKIIQEQGRAFMFMVLAPALLTVSFMHCKNVELVERGGRKPGEPRKRKAKTKHYILEIEPMKKILRSEGESETTGIKQALHICRGHFKDYNKGKGKGLFGKYKGLYWWDSQVRGRKEEGEVVKQYNVNPNSATQPGVAGDVVPIGESEKQSGDLAQRA